jgi:hypothetical protein
MGDGPEKLKAVSLLLKRIGRGIRTAKNLKLFRL